MFCCNLQAVHEIAAPQARIDAKTSRICLLLTSQIAKTVELLLPGTKQPYGKTLSRSSITTTYGIEVAGGPFRTFAKAGLESVL